ncbi:hypothetical protein OH77DRAFT_66548 [Trametes cingulata]|nr:hypothetical protein OH77DRAFT_66548 [Trametes cingulata]
MAHGRGKRRSPARPRHVFIHNPLHHHSQLARSHRLTLPSPHFALRPLFPRGYTPHFPLLPCTSLPLSARSPTTPSPRSPLLFDSPLSPPVLRSLPSAVDATPLLASPARSSAPVTRSQCAHVSSAGHDESNRNATAPPTNRGLRTRLRAVAPRGRRGQWLPSESQNPRPDATPMKSPARDRDTSGLRRASGVVRSSPRPRSSPDRERSLSFTSSRSSSCRAWRYVSFRRVHSLSAHQRSLRALSYPRP